jgi:hypothetical protein
MEDEALRYGEEERLSWRAGQHQLADQILQVDARPSAQVAAVAVVLLREQI